MTGFDFDELLDRRDVPALKTHRVVLGEGGDDLFAAGVADMDFRVAPAIVAAMRKRLNHEIFGYEAVPDGLIPALQGWQARRHDWVIPSEHILRAPNALNVLAISALLFSDPGDGIIVQPPVFFDFFDVIEENGRTVIRNPLLFRQGRYEMDFDGLETLARHPANKILFLCSPHNPVGRVWTREELIRLSEICHRHDVLIVSDELHADIVYPGHKHVPFASLGPVAAAHSVTILSPAKSFNVASCCSAFSVIPDSDRRRAFQRENSRLTVNKNNAFANAAMEAAYQQGAEWLDAVIAYLQGNLTLLQESVAPLDGVELVRPEATFLVWLDFRKLGMTPDDLHGFLRDEVRWAVTRGTSFGPEGTGFVRLNIACPRTRLNDALAALGSRLRSQV